MITIAGAGVAGLASALELARRGMAVTLYERGASPADHAASWYAGGMLAPFCEGETAPPEVVRLGQGTIDWWSQITQVEKRGTLVVAPPRDRTELDRFARRTSGHQRLDAGGIAALEPALAGRFASGLFFAEEAHLDPRQALRDLADAAKSLGVNIRYGTPAPEQVDVDCRGAASTLPGLRQVRGEMAVIEAPDLKITRTIRLLHPRIPVYLVPRGSGRYMIGATMIESDASGPISLRSLLELLGAAFALHPGFAEARVIETGTGLRPAFADNMPRLVRQGDTLHLNGLYRHGFLLAPALAGQLAEQFFRNHADDHHSDHDHSTQRRTA